MKMAIYYEIYARLTIEPRRNLIEERLKKPLENYIKFEVYHTYYHSLRGYRYKFATLRNYRLQVPRTRLLEVSRTNTETNLLDREK